MPTCNQDDAEEYDTEFMQEQFRIGYTFDQTVPFRDPVHIDSIQDHCRTDYHQRSVDLASVRSSIQLIVIGVETLAILSGIVLVGGVVGIAAAYRVAIQRIEDYQI